MPLESYFDNLEPDVPDAEIWRFMPFHYFEDLMANQELYFRRADLFTQDEEEGIPPEAYVRRVMGIRPFDIEGERQLIHMIGVLAQDREAFFVNCWHLHRSETVEMWRGFAEDGIAIRSRYDLLRSILSETLDTSHVGLVRYGEDRLFQTGKMNVLQFINTKRKWFEQEKEVRAILWCPDPFAGNNRHFDHNNVPHLRPLPENPRHAWVSEGKRRRIDLSRLIIGIVVSPFAAPEILDMTRSWVRVRNHSCDVQRSILTVG